MVFLTLITTLRLDRLSRPPTPENAVVADEVEVGVVLGVSSQGETLGDGRLQQRQRLFSLPQMLAKQAR